MKPRKSRKTELFGTSLLDILSGGFAAVCLLFVMSQAGMLESIEVAHSELASGREKVQALASELDDMATISEARFGPNYQSRLPGLSGGTPSVGFIEDDANAVIFIIDSSGSMGRQPSSNLQSIAQRLWTKWDLVRAVIARNLTSGQAWERFAIVTTGGAPISIALKDCSPCLFQRDMAGNAWFRADKREIAQALEGLKNITPEGGHDLAAANAMAFQLGREWLDSTEITEPKLQIILLTDDLPNRGPTHPRRQECRPRWAEYNACSFADDPGTDCTMCPDARLSRAEEVIRLFEPEIAEMHSTSYHTVLFGPFDDTRLSLFAAWMARLGHGKSHAVSEVLIDELWGT